MMWRAFIPARDKHDTDAFPMWLVSFDGVRFVEVTEKPDVSRADTLRALWSVTVDGPRKKKRQAILLAPPIFELVDISKIAELEEVSC